MDSSQPPPSRYPASMGPGARSPTRFEPGSIQERIAIRRQYNIERLEEGLKLEYNLNETQRSFVVPYSAFPLSSMLTSTYTYTQISGMCFIDHIRAAEQFSGIAPTQQSVQAFAQHCSQYLIWKQVGNAASVFAAVWYWNKGRSDMKFPLRIPREPQKYNNFPNRFIPIIKGPLARGLWQCTRFGVLMLYGIVFLKPFVFTPVGRSIMTLELDRDERVRPIMDALKKRKREAVLSNQQRSGRNRTSRPMPTPAQATTTSSSSEDYPYGERPTDTMVDGYSESGVSYGDSMGSTGDVPPETLPGTQQQYQTQRQQPQPQRYQQRTRYPDQTASNPSNQQSSSDDPFAFNEDPQTSSSTLDPDSPQYNPNASSQPKPRRSWASIRNEARRDAQANSPTSQGSPYSNDASGSASPPSGRFPNPDSYGPQPVSPRNRNLAPARESYEYAAAQGDAQRQKDQREFDALLERERRLGRQDQHSRPGDGSGGGGGGDGG